MQTWWGLRDQLQRDHRTSSLVLDRWTNHPFQAIDFPSWLFASNPLPATSHSELSRETHFLLVSCEKMYKHNFKISLENKLSPRSSAGPILHSQQALIPECERIHCNHHRDSAHDQALSMCLQMIQAGFHSSTSVFQGLRASLNWILAPVSPFSTAASF